MLKKFNRTQLIDVLIAACIVVLLSVLTTVLVLAQAGDGQSGGEGTAGGSSPAAPEANVGFSIPVQGRLTDAGGAPLNGFYKMTFRLYHALSGGPVVCSDVNTNVPVSNGLFNTYIWGDCGNFIDGQQLYVGIEVESDGEMTPRQPIYPVPYATSLMPGAVISATIGGLPVLHLENPSPTGRGLRAYATSSSGVNYGVIGATRSSSGYGGYFYNNGGGVSLWGWSTGVGHPSIFGCTNADDSACDPGTNPAGVAGKSSLGDGVLGITSNMTYRGVYASNDGGGIALAANSDSVDTTNHTRPTLYLVQSNASGDYVVGASSYFGTRTWRVDRTGKGYFNGGTQASGADFAEQISVMGSESAYEAGDVLVISSQADRTVERSGTPYSSAVIGVYSSDPAVLAGAADKDGPLAGVPVAIVGIVPCKVSAENGPIQRGDLLVTASLPGYAMRAGDNPPQGTVLGKAMQTLESGSGTILILVVLQ
jgi:hypothetical protein